MREVIGDGDMLAVLGHRDVARVDAGADFGDNLQAPQIVSRHPSVARHESYEAAVWGELGAAVKSKPGWEPRMGSNVSPSRMVSVMISGLDHDE